MFAAGLLLWINFSHKELYKDESVIIHANGWPCNFQSGMSIPDGQTLGPIKARILERFKNNDPQIVAAFDRVSEIDRHYARAIAIDIAVFLLMLFVIGVVIEILIRRARTTKP